MPKLVQGHNPIKLKVQIDEKEGKSVHRIDLTGCRERLHENSRTKDNKTARSRSKNSKAQNQVQQINAVSKKPGRAERPTNFSKNTATTRGQIAGKKTQVAAKNAESGNPKRNCYPEKKTMKVDRLHQQVGNGGTKAMTSAISPKSMLRYESCEEDSLLSPEIHQKSERK